MSVELEGVEPAVAQAERLVDCVEGLATGPSHQLIGTVGVDHRTVGAGEARYRRAIERDRFDLQAAAVDQPGGLGLTANHRPNMADSAQNSRENTSARAM